MELFKLLGTIAVDAADALKAFKKTQEEGENTESKLGKVFSGIGKGAVVVGKAVAKGMVVGATAVTGLAAAAVKSYADYEQLVGGVETLFGSRGAKSVEEYANLVGKSVKDVEAEFGMLQEAQSAVMNNAANAYKTCGLSANAYMETATSLAAALNQSSASQLDSANLADQAITDMSDNANKMGTSMEAIQNAYNGFSKQNYTMLDNLKLGYGGTKEEMQRLLKDAGNLKSAMGRKFDINNFADVTEAIHLMQVEMGISGISYKEYQKLVESGAMSEAEAFKLLGTTAKEANFTIAGSLGQLKGAWSNLLTGMADENANVGDLMNNLVESAAIALRNIIPRVTQALSGISAAIAQIVPILEKEIPNLFQEALPSIIQAVVNLFDAVVGALPGIISAIQTMLPQLIDGFMQIFTGLVEALISALPMLIEGVLQLITSLATALPQVIQPILEALPTIIQSIISALPTLIPALVDGLVQIIVMLCEMLPQIIMPIIDNLPMIITTIVSALLENLPALISGLIQLTAGIIAALPQICGALIMAIPAALKPIWDGIVNLFTPLTEWFSNLWDSLGNVPGLSNMKTMIEQVWGAIKNFITTYIGAIKDIITTYWNAIKNNISAVINAIKNVISTAWNAIKTIISNVMKLISSVLKGDWQGVKNAISNILNAIKSVILSVWNGIKSIISTALNGIKSVVSSVWNGIKSVVTSYLNTIKTVVSSIWNGIKGTISSVLKGIKTTVTTGFNEVKNKVTGAFKDLPSKLKSIGGDLISGLWNGIGDKFSWLTGKIKGFAKNVTDKLKGFFGIKSPSRVFRDQIGKMLAEGVAVGIKDKESKAAKAAEDMAKNVLDAAQDRLDNYKVYNEMTLADEVAFWDSVRNQIKEGTDARLKADEKYVAAKQSLNDELLSAEETLQKKLDSIAQKVTDRQNSLVNSLSLFGEVQFDEWLGANTMFNKLGEQVLAMEKYQTEVGKLRNKIGGTALFSEIEKMGINALPNIQTINNMTAEQLEEFKSLYDQKVALAGEIASKELEEETIAETAAAYQEYETKCAELGVGIVDSTNAMATGVKNAFEGIAQAVQDAGTIIAEVCAEQIKKPLDDVAISLGSPSIFNYDAASGEFGGYTSGSTASGTQGKNSHNSTVISYLKNIVEVLTSYFPQLINAFDMDVCLDTGVLVGELAPEMNEELGRISFRKDRGL